MEMTTTLASERLGVSRRQVERLAESGVLIVSQRVGRAWLVDATSVDRLMRSNPNRGRPWSASTAWGALWVLSGYETPWLSAQQLRRLRQRLATITPAVLVAACRRRSTVTRWRASGSFLPGIANYLELTGVSALQAGRDEMGPSQDRLDGYATAETQQTVVERFVLVADPTGNLTIRVADLPRTIPEGSVPAAVVAADLAESDDPRERHLGLDRLEELLA